MGQYYRALALKKNFKRCKCAENAIVAALSPYDFDNLAKLMEHSYCGNTYVNAAMKLLSEKAYGHPFVWCGDYFDDFMLKSTSGKNLYYCANNWIDKHSRYLIKSINETEDKGWKYIINFDKMLYVKVPPFNPTRYTMHPLPLLCCAGNGEGGGDYILDVNDKNFKYVGSWAFDRIGVSTNRPHPRFKCLNIKFKCPF